jgi:hypothetical protein
LSAISSALKGLTKYVTALENAIKTDEKRVAKIADDRLKLDIKIEAGKIEIDRAKNVVANYRQLETASAKVEATAETSTLRD